MEVFGSMSLMSNPYLGLYVEFVQHAWEDKIYRASEMRILHRVAKAMSLSKLERKMVARMVSDEVAVTTPALLPLRAEWAEHVYGEALKGALRNKVLNRSEYSLLQFIRKRLEISDQFHLEQEREIRSTIKLVPDQAPFLDLILFRIKWKFFGKKVKEHILSENPYLGVYRDLVRAAYADEVIRKSEMEVLVAAALAMEIAEPEAWFVIQSVIAEEMIRTPPLPDYDPEVFVNIYRAACAQALSDAEVDRHEYHMLQVLQERLSITPLDHLHVEDAIRTEQAMLDKPTLVEKVMSRMRVVGRRGRRRKLARLGTGIPELAPTPEATPPAP